MMRPALLVLLAAVPVIAGPRHHQSRDLEDQWDDAVDAAYHELVACSELATQRHVFGDVDVSYDSEHGMWSTTTSKSLFGAAGELGACVQGAIERHAHLDGHRGSDRLLDHHQPVGKIIPVLPAPADVLPIWRLARTGGTAARAAFARMLPPDSTLMPDGCVRTSAESLRQAHDLWRATVGPWVPRLWQRALTAELGQPIRDAVWDGSEALVTDGPHGMCLVPLDAARQATLRARFDTIGSCWAGSFTDLLLHPRVELPPESYRDVAIHGDRVCAVTANGDVTCCGSREHPLPAAPAPVTTIALGESFACGLDRAHEVRCWGDIAAPPPGTFGKVSAGEDHACAVRSTGEIECWGKHVAPPPAGRFDDLAATFDGGCAIRGGSAECWGNKNRAAHPPGSFTHVAAEMSRACAIRSDGTVGCWTRPDDPVDTPLPDAIDQVVVGTGDSGCGRRTSDRNAACWGTRAPTPPAGPVSRIAGDRQTFCAVREAGGIACWGDPWPTAWLRGSNHVKALPAATPPGMLAGRIIDPTGAPIAGAEVALCVGTGGCTPITFPSRSSSATIAELIAAAPATWPRSGVSYAKTDAAGRWQAAMPRDTRGEAYLQLVATAPGRELADRTFPLAEPAAFAEGLVLRSGAALDVDAMCDGSPCTGKVLVATALFRNTGRHLERLPPGTYTLIVRARPGEPGEAQANVVVDVRFGSPSQRVRADLRPTGTGMSITGRVIGGGEQVSVEVRCGPDDDPVYRQATMHGNRFEVFDAPPPPCVVEASGYEPPGYDGVPESHPGKRVKVDKLPAKLDIIIRD